MKPVTNFKHPEDAIFYTKTFINELQTVQETYFNELVSNLNLTERGDEFLFDYIYNETEDQEDFSTYLQNLNIEFESLVKPNFSSDHMDHFIPTNFGDCNLTMHMNLEEYEPDTSFPSAFESNYPEYNPNLAQPSKEIKLS